MTCLERLSEFLYREAEYAINGGLLNLNTTTLNTRNNDRDSNNAPRRQGRTHNPTVVLTTSVRHESTPRINDFNPVNTPCVVRGQDNHKIRDCSEFGKESFGNRRRIIRKAGFCYKCLDTHHIARNCTKAVECSIFHRSHHTAMHISRKGNFNDKHDRDVRKNSGRPRHDRNSRPAADQI